MFESPKRHHFSNDPLTRKSSGGGPKGLLIRYVRGFPLGGLSRLAGIRLSRRPLKTHHVLPEILIRCVYEPELHNASPKPGFPHPLP